MHPTHLAAIALLASTIAAAAQAQFTPISQQRSISASYAGCIDDFPGPQICDNDGGSQSAAGFGLFDTAVFFYASPPIYDGGGEAHQDSTIGPSLIEASGSIRVLAETGSCPLGASQGDATCDFSATFSVSAPTAARLSGWVGKAQNATASVKLSGGPGVSITVAPAANAIAPFDQPLVLAAGTYTLEAHLAKASMPAADDAAGFALSLSAMPMEDLPASTVIPISQQRSVAWFDQYCTSFSDPPCSEQSGSQSAPGFGAWTGNAFGAHQQSSVEPAEISAFGRVTGSIGATTIDGESASAQADSDFECSFVVVQPVVADVLLVGIGGGTATFAPLGDVQGGPVESLSGRVLLAPGTYTVGGSASLNLATVLCHDSMVHHGWFFLRLRFLAESCPADLDDNGVVDGADLGLLLGQWGPGGGSADLDGNGVVDGADLGLLLGAWGPC